jgi:hypothetical protein
MQHVYCRILKYLFLGLSKLWNASRTNATKNQGLAVHYVDILGKVLYPLVMQFKCWFVPESIFLSIMYLRKQFLHRMWPFQLAIFFIVIIIICRTFLFSLTLSNNTSFLTWLVELISMLLQHHISKPSRYFWSTFRSVHVSALCSVMLQM